MKQNIQNSEWYLSHDYKDRDNVKMLLAEAKTSTSIINLIIYV